MNIKNSVSFNVDHSKLTRGVYFSKKDVLSDVATITFDMRMRVPYKEEVISNEEMHTFEHCFATAVRDVAEKYDNMAISYFGPMGCQTGYYLVVNFVGVEDKDYFPMLLKLLDDSCNYIENMTEVPAKNELQCGNCYSLGDIDLAKKAGKDLKALVDEMKEQKGFHKYTYM